MLKIKYPPPRVFLLLIVLCMVVTGTRAQGGTATAPASRPSVEKLATPLDFVTVGDVGNPADSRTGTGSVPYVFDCGKYEVTNAQYCDFLNAVAGEKDPHGLYSINMTRGLFGGIERKSKDGRFIYSPLPGYTNLPVVYVSWYDCARYCNWLHYGKPKGPSVIGTTEGDDKRGAYDTRDIDSRPRIAQRVKTRNAGAKFWLPTLDEWDKAAFYDATKNGKGGYWLYPTQSDTKPRCVPPGKTPNSVNYYDFKWAAPDPYLTPVGGYTASASHYGTFDQGGNVWEWSESLAAPNGATRRVRGGGATVHSNTLVITNFDAEYGDHELYIFGFRVCRANRGTR